MKIWIAEREDGFNPRIWTDDEQMRDRLRENGYTITEVQPVGDRMEPVLPEAPATFLFGIDDPFEDGGIYVWIVAEPFFRETGYVNDSSSAKSVLTKSQRDAYDETDDGVDKAESMIEAAHNYLDQATRGILFGEGMESAWEGAINKGESRNDAVARIKAALEERGLVHEPKLDQEGWSE